MSNRLWKVLHETQYIREYIIKVQNLYNMRRNPDSEQYHQSLFCSEFAHLIHALASEFDSTNS